MRRFLFAATAKTLFAAGMLLCISSQIVAARPSKCSAPTVMDFEGTDQEGITKKCQAIFGTCIDESAPCETRKKNCAKYDRMDRDGSCYKKRRS
jgi:hypothetical protein